MKSKEIEEDRRHDILYERIASIIRKKIVLTISFITESTIWSPGLQMVTKIKSLGASSSVKNLGEQSLVRDYEDEQVFQYPNGLIMKQHLYSAIDDVSSSDGVFCIFDARVKEHVDPQWKDMIIRIIKSIKDKGVVLIGIRALESSSWSEIIGELNVDEQLNEKPIELLFFRIGEDYQIDIFDQLKAMFTSIDDKY